MRTDELDAVEAELRQGRFGGALALLDGGAADSARHDHSTLKAELLLYTGCYARARDLAETRLRKRGLSRVIESRCHVVLGLAAAEEGDHEHSISGLQKAVHLASVSADLTQLCRAQLDLLGRLSDRVDSSALASISAEVRRNILGHGDPHFLIRYHLNLAEAEGKRGFLEVASRHIRTAAVFLRSFPNFWLEGLLELDASTIECMKANFPLALSSANRALQLSDLSGHMRTRLGAMANLGLLHLYSDDLLTSEKYLFEALAATAPGSTLRDALLDSISQLRLAKGDVASVKRAYEGLDHRKENNSPQDAAHIHTWYELAALPTRISLHLAYESWNQAEKLATSAMSVADSRSDGLLGAEIRLQRAEALTELGRGTEAAEMIAEAAGMSESLSLVTTAELERVKGKLFARIGERGRARVDFQRALRILEGVGHERGRVKTQADAERAGIALEWAERSIGADSTASREDDRKVRSDADWINSLSALLELADHPQLFAVEAFATLCGSGWTRRVSLTHGEPGTEPTLVLSHGPSTADRENADAEPCLRRWRIDAGEDSYFELGFEPEPSPTAQCQLVSWQRIAKVILALRAYRAEAKRRAAIWPIDSAAPSADGVFVASKTLENLAIAQQVAPTSMPVLITGETGTGKEILARAIHRHSNRASRPFVPYNCSAVGRDLIDSQLFGHRRGAFTGAHESTPGVIRAANGGTLFLDEIGELDLELQPKLLRFLETGEIHPLGEPKPLVVDVRVIAATNVDIDQRVVEGRFREDLYYRLNVIRLDIPPLRNRREEIPPLIQQFLQQFGSSEQRRQGLRLAEDTLEYLLLYDWPGNVRHLANEIRRLIGLAGSDSVILPAALSPAIRAARRTQPRAPTDTANGKAAESTVAVSLDQPLAQAVAELERAMLQRALAASGGHVERAARALGLSRKGLFLKRKRLGLA